MPPFGWTDYSSHGYTRSSCFIQTICKSHLILANLFLFIVNNVVLVSYRYHTSDVLSNRFLVLLFHSNTVSCYVAKDESFSLRLRRRRRNEVESWRWGFNAGKAALLEEICLVPILFIIRVRLR